MSIHKLANDLRNLQNLLKETKDEETRMRKELASKIGLETMDVGMHKIEDGDLIIKATRKVSHSLDVAALQDKEVWNLLSDAEKSAVNWKPSLSLKVYKQLADTDMLDEYIEVKPAMPAITVEFVGE